MIPKYPASASTWAALLGFLVVQAVVDETCPYCESVLTDFRGQHRLCGVTFKCSLEGEHHSCSTELHAAKVECLKCCTEWETKDICSYSMDGHRLPGCPTNGKH